MSRIGIEYSKAAILGIFAVMALVVILVAGAPSPIYIGLPVLLGLLAIGVWWRADAVYKNK